MMWQEKLLWHIVIPLWCFFFGKLNYGVCIIWQCTNCLNWIAWTMLSCKFTNIRRSVLLEIRVVIRTINDVLLRFHRDGCTTRTHCFPCSWCLLKLVYNIILLSWHHENSQVVIFIQLGSIVICHPRLLFSNTYVVETTNIYAIFSIVKQQAR